MNAKPRRRAELSLFTDEDIRQGIELLFFAYRDFTADPDRILAPLAYGRAHHRAIHFVGRNPGITVGDLLAILSITKQSLNRVLSQLMREGYIIARPGETDRRERRLMLTPAGATLEHRLSEPQRARVGGAYRRAGPQAVDGFRRVLLEIIEPKDRNRLPPMTSRASSAPLSARQRLR
jgi:DNA-binding MarR family transcriptional regulator